ncbi:MAG: hypothetical protein II919_05585 [Lachnospiraceae bacterium]|nr:hypothetical protein [Lachnospiraceae bacterium]
MLGKLIKHEFRATYKTYLLLFGTLLLLTVLSKITFKVDTGFIFYEIVRGLFLVIDIVLMVAVGFVGTFLVIARVYRHLLKDEGYLSHTLPVKTSQHILTKCITGTVWILLSYIMMAIAILIYVGEYGEVWDAVTDFFNDLSEEPKLIGAAILFLLICIVAVASNVLSYIAALSLGQLFKKHKIVGAVVFWFVMNYALSIVLTVIQFFTGTLFDRINDLDFRVDGYVFLYTVLTVILIGEILLSGIYFFISNYMLTKKLNLE